MRTNGHHTADLTDDPTAVPTEALTVAEAAEALGITTEAARMRVKRGTLPSTRIDGTVYVLVDRPNPRPNGPNAGPNDQPNPRPNGAFGGTNARSNGHPDAGNTAVGPLLAAKDETIAVLREQLQAEREANRENRRIIAGLVQRIPELEAAPEPPQAPESAPEDPEGASPRSDTVGPQTGVQEPEETTRRSWWRRWFGVD